MTHQLLIRILEQTDTQSGALMAQWGLIHTELKRLMDVSVSPLDSIKPTLESKYASLLILKTIVVVPGQFVTLRDVDIPSKQTRQIQQALPFALEESLANEAKDNFFALGPRNVDGNFSVAVVTHQKMKYWLEQIEKSSLRMDVMLPDTLLVPRDAPRNTLVVSEEVSWLRWGEYQGLRFQNVIAPTVLKSMDQNALSSGFSVMSAGSEEAKASLGEIKDLIDRYCASHPPEKQTVDDGEGSLNASDLLSDTGAKQTSQQMLSQPHLLSPLHAFAEEILAGKSSVASQFNLLQGQYKPKGPGVSLGFNWKPLAAVAAVWFVAIVSVELLSTAKFSSEADQYQQQAESLYRSYFPKDKRIVDVKSQTVAHLKRAGNTGAGAGMLELLHPAGKALHQFNKKSSASPLKINRISFEERLKELRLDISAHQFDQLDQLKVTLEKQGLSVEIGSAVAQKDGVESRIKIKRG